MSERIQIVEDDEGTQALLCLYLSMAGYRVVQSRSAEEAWPILEAGGVDIAIVDWTLPGEDGLALVAKMRQHPLRGRLPVIMISGRSDDTDKVRALERGADDYVTKPFHTRELIARVQALLRRAARSDAKPLELDGLRLDPVQQRASVGSRALALRSTEYRLLQTLVSRPSQVHTREQLLERIWPDDLELTQRAVDACVARVRQQLESAGHYPCIQTVRSVGYRLVRRDEGLVHG